MPLVYLSADVIGDAFSAKRKCNVGKQNKCEQLCRNRNQEYTYKSWHCSALVQNANVADAEKHEQLKTLCETKTCTFEDSMQK